MTETSMRNLPSNSQSYVRDSKLVLVLLIQHFSVSRIGVQGGLYINMDIQTIRTIKRRVDGCISGEPLKYFGLSKTVII